jgi:hypothetical protein
LNFSGGYEYRKYIENTIQKLFYDDIMIHATQSSNDPPWFVLCHSSISRCKPILLLEPVKNRMQALSD